MIEKPGDDSDINSSTDELRITYTYSSASGGMQSPRWAYDVYDAGSSYTTPYAVYSSTPGGEVVTGMVSKFGFMSGRASGSYDVYVTLLDGGGSMFNPPVVDHVSFDYQSTSGVTAGEVVIKVRWIPDSLTGYRQVS